MAAALKFIGYGLREIAPHNLLRGRVDGRDIHVRPLTPIVDYPQAPQAITFQSLTAWRHSKQYETICRYFERYPENSLLEPFERAFLYHAVRCLKPKYVLEVGTFFTASAEIMARAMWENGEGQVNTADPLGFHRCGRIIRRWPKDLRRHVRYWPVTSQFFFHRWRKKQVLADMAFVDGNHDFEFALFDLLSAARFIRPGGLIVLDDVDQPGPLWAALEFLRMYPGWQAIGGSFDGFSINRPFDSAPGLMGSRFFVLQAPEGVTLGGTPFTTGQCDYRGSEGNITLELKDTPKGTLHGKVYLRHSGDGKLPRQYEALFSEAIEGKRQLTIALPEALQQHMRRWQPGKAGKQTLEIILHWQPEKPGELLSLAQPPQAN